MGNGSDPPSRAAVNGLASINGCAWHARLLSVPGVAEARQAGPGERVPPPGLGDYDEKIAAARQQKDASLDAGDVGRAAVLRVEEKRLQDERAARMAQWSAGVDVAALAEEIDRLHLELARLRDLLLRNGIQPGGGHQKTA